MGTKTTATGDAKGSAEAEHDDSVDQRKEPTLDELLAEWDKPAKAKGEGDGKPAKPTAKAGGDDDKVSKLEQEVETLKGHLTEQSYRQTMDKVIDDVRGDFSADEDYVEWWINKRAEQDDRLKDLWNERGQKPQEFQKAMDALGREFQQHWRERVQGAETQSRRRASTATFASSSTSHGSQDDRISDELASANDRDFALKKSEIFRQYERSGRGG